MFFVRSNYFDSTLFRCHESDCVNHRDTLIEACGVDGSQQILAMLFQPFWWVSVVQCHHPVVIGFTTATNFHSFNRSASIICVDASSQVLLRRVVLVLEWRSWALRNPHLIKLTPFAHSGANMSCNVPSGFVSYNAPSSFAVVQEKSYMTRWPSQRSFNRIRYCLSRTIRSTS